MDLGATQQTQEKPGSTVTFPSAVIIIFKTTVYLSLKDYWCLPFLYLFITAGEYLVISLKD